MTDTPARTGHTFPTDETLAGLMDQVASGGEDPPVVMLNLNRYRDVASYGDERDAEGLSGRHAYLRYGIVAKAAIEAGGGRILWATDAAAPIIGCDHDAYDEVVAVWYPSTAAFLALNDHPGYPEALQHRDAAIEQAALIPCKADAEPRLTSPFDA